MRISRSFIIAFCITTAAIFIVSLVATLDRASASNGSTVAGEILADRVEREKMAAPADSPVRQEPRDIQGMSLWDDADSRKWIAEGWGDPLSVQWLGFDGRSTIQATVTPAGQNWAIMRTDAFPAENWESKSGFRADIYQAGGNGGVDVKLEVRGESFDTIVQSMTCHNIAQNAWHTCTWSFNTSVYDYRAVHHISLVFDDLKDAGPTFYVDDLRLLSGSAEEAWDDMADGSLEWFYFGNWINWAPSATFGLEPVSHNGANPTSPAGSVYLKWDYPNGAYPGATAEVGTSKLEGQHDWSAYDRLVADVKISNADAPISVFLWNTDGISMPLDYRGFGSPTRRAGGAGEWQRIAWDLPWPPWFDKTSVDELKFVVNNIDQHQVGELFIDNIALVSADQPAAATGLAYIMEDFDDSPEGFNDFSGNWGALVSDSITLTVDSDVQYDGLEGSSLRFDYHVSAQSFAGMWQSLWGHVDYTATQTIDFTDIFGRLNEEDKGFEQLQFWVRSSGQTTTTHNIKIELKDASGDFHHTAYRYITIDDGDTDWRQIVLDADVLNGDFWSYNQFPPDPTRMKQMVFVVESFFNDPAGTFFVDQIQFVDVDDQPFDPASNTDDEFLDLIEQKTFLYFLDWAHPDTGLTQDRSTFPDLMSTAATGFGLTALTIGQERGWITRELAIDLIIPALQTLHDGQSASTTVSDAISDTNGYKGFYYHFLGEDGLRKGDNELSSVDTALLLFAIENLRVEFSDEPQIVDLAGKIYERIEWDWMLDPASQQFYLGWKPVCGPGFTKPAPGGGCFTSKLDGNPLVWDYYTDEVILINLLAIGSPTHPVPADVFYAWDRVQGSYDDYTLIQTWPGPLFTYFFAHLWIDFEPLGLDDHPTQPVDWWTNSISATLANRQFVLDHMDDNACDEDDSYTTYGPFSWGLTAADGPDGNYHPYGAEPAAAITVTHDGTIAPYGAGSSISFAPELVTPTLRHFFAGTDLWRYRSGFGDAYNLEPDQTECGDPWVNRAGFGIDQGPLLIAIENYRSGYVWELTRGSEAIRGALCQIYDCSEIEPVCYLPAIFK